MAEMLKCTLARNMKHVTVLDTTQGLKGENVLRASTRFSNSVVIFFLFEGFVLSSYLESLCGV